ncbi:MAG TPA: phenylalanine--tRNA ligase subunit beta [Candidatus Saccharimonadales bacterium]|nr:phenylalanine--tRNA ligase subunit beta [Candidatus Saccharimonadales bacterium]
MKLSVNLIKKFADINLSTSALVDAIGMQIGAVESVEELSDRYRGASIVKVIECKPHPNADRLKVCLVDDGGKNKEVKRVEGGYIQVVCGAPNVKAGLMVVWLPPGSIVPITFDKEPQKLSALEIRGVASNGMLASAKELGISDDHRGILVVDLPSRPGQSFEVLYELNDTIIEIENKMLTHRPDLFGHLGLAREIAGITHQSFTSPNWYLNLLKALEASSFSKLEVKNELPKLVPRFMAQVISGVSVGPSDLKLQTYLTRLGLKPINNVVDQTNYAMILTGQPFHAYDYDKLSKLDKTPSQATLVVRHPKKGETLNLINGKQVSPTSNTIGIASKTKLIGLGGVMGGSETEISDSTRNIILECAVFDMNVIRRTAMSLGVFSDAVTRFTKGIPPAQTDNVLANATQSLVGAAGGEAQSPVDVHEKLKPNPKIEVKADFINNRLGSSLSSQTMIELLGDVEFNVAQTNGLIRVQAPFWRTDIEIPEDIVEEIGRLYGYQNLSIDLPKRVIEPAVSELMFETKKKIRDVLSGAGANELLTYSFVHGNLLSAVGQDQSKAYQIQNAISPELQFYRLSLLPSLLEKIHPNIKTGHDEFVVFEMNPVHQKKLMDSKEPNLPEESQRLALVFAADDKLSGKTLFGAPYYQALNYLNYIFDYLGVPFELKPLELSVSGDSELSRLFEIGRSANIWSGKTNLGIVGEPKQSIRQKLKLPKYTSMFELYLDALNGLTSGNVYHKLSQFPSIERDMTFRVEAGLIYSDLRALLVSELDGVLGTETLYKIDCIDIYQDQQNKKFKSFTFRLKLNSYKKTLSSDEANEVVLKLAGSAKKKLKAELN